MEDLKSLEESIRVSYTARDKKTNHLRVESRALTLSEAAWHVYRQCSYTLPDVGLRLYSTDGNYRVI